MLTLIKRKIGRSGITFIELVIVIGLFSVMLSVMMGLMYNSDVFFTKGQDKITEQFEARKVLDLISREMRSSAPDWVINSTHYPFSVSENNTRMDFYVPIFDADNQVTGLRKITYKLDPEDPARLLMKEGTLPEKAVSGRIDYVNFGAGCAGCASFDCASPADDCPIVRLEVRTVKDNQFDLVTKIALRNINTTVSDEAEIEAPGEGEF